MILVVAGSVRVMSSVLTCGGSAPAAARRCCMSGRRGECVCRSGPAQELRVGRSGAELGCPEVFRIAELTLSGRPLPPASAVWRPGQVCAMTVLASGGRDEHGAGRPGEAGGLRLAAPREGEDAGRTKEGNANVAEVLNQAQMML